MQLRKLFDDDNAVSPVIGVILMVAITVILAAVIATFVLGLGEQVSSTAPQASFSSDFTENPSGSSDDCGNSYSSVSEDGALTITATSGEGIQASALKLSGSSVDDSCFYDENAYGSDSSIGAGDSITIAVKFGDEVSVIWIDPDSDKTATLTTKEVPDN